jgi:SEL1 protein
MYKRAEEEDDLLSGGSDRHHLDDRHEDGYYDDLEIDIDEAVLEGLIIVALAATLLVLVYMRQQRNRQRQNDNAGANPAAPDNGNDRGFFPRPGDPEFAQWAAGGVGH